MSKPELPPGEDRPQRPPRDGGKPTDKQPPTNLLWYLVIGAILLAGCMVWLGTQTRGKVISLGEFERGLEPAEEGKAPRFNENNVFNLKIGSKEITFQDQPVEEVSQEELDKGDIGPPKDDVNTYRIPAFEIGDVKKNDLTRKLNEKGIEWGFASGPSEWYQVAYLLLIPMMFLIFFIITWLS